MKTEDWINLLGFALFPAMLVIERFWPARQFPRVPFWHWIGIGLLLYSGALNVAVLALLPAEWLSAHRLFHLSQLGLLPSIVVGQLVITLVTFIWHRVTHEVHFLWRGFHQMHHAPRHLNIYAANCMHPADLAFYVAIPVVIALLVLGVDPLAAVILGNLGAFNAFFQHWNMRTPRWIGYLFQRPEAHCIHHERGLHRYNYSDLPLWDIVFGTFRNPRTWQGETGFDEPADGRYGAMLAFVDVNAPRMGDYSFGQSPEQNAAR